MAPFPGGSCFNNLLRGKPREAQQQLQVHGECGRERATRRADDDGQSIEECNQQDYDYNSDYEEEEEEETSSFILHDCAPQNCYTAPERPSSPPVVPSPSQSRTPSSNLQPSPAVHHHHHNHCLASRANIIAEPSDAVPCTFRWDIALLRALRKDPISNRREANKRRQPGRVDISFVPKKGDLLIHVDRKQWRRVLEFYDPAFQRLHDGDILIRIRIDSYSCIGIVLMKGTGYMYHRGYWMFLGTDSDQISQYLRGR